MDQDPRLHLAVRGDRQALRGLVQQWWPKICRWSRVFCVDAHLAEEGAQEAVVRILRSIDRYDPTREFGPWLRVVVKNACHDVGRTRQRHTAEVLEDLPDTESRERQVDLRRGASRAVAAFERLTPRQRELLVRVDIDSETPSEVARDLGLTPGAVRNQLFTARRAVRAALARDTDLLRLVREA